MGSPRRARAAWKLDLEPQQASGLSIPKSVEWLRNERDSRTGLIPSGFRFSQNVGQRSGTASGNLGLDFSDETLPTTAWREIALDLAIPRLFFHLFEPVKKLLSFMFGKVADFFFDRFNGHIITIARER